MLKIRQIDKIRSLFYEENLTTIRISKILKLSRNTIYKYVNTEDFNIKPRKKICAKIDEYSNIIDSWLEQDTKMPRKQRHTFKRIYERLIEEYPDFNLSYSSVQTYARQAKAKFIKPYNCYLPLLHNPGEAQVDFFDCVFVG